MLWAISHEHEHQYDPCMHNINHSYKHNYRWYFTFQNPIIPNNLSRHNKCKHNTQRQYKYTQKHLRFSVHYILCKNQPTDCNLQINYVLIHTSVCRSGTYHGSLSMSNLHTGSPALCELQQSAPCPALKRVYPQFSSHALLWLTVMSQSQRATGRVGLLISVLCWSYIRTGTGLYRYCTENGCEKSGLRRDRNWRCPVWGEHNILW